MTQPTQGAVTETPAAVATPADDAGAGVVHYMTVF